MGGSGSGGVAKPPSDLTGFAGLLWQIVKSKGQNNQEIAKALGISPTFLRDIFSERTVVSQVFVYTLLLPQIISEYTDAYKGQLKQDFEIAILQLPYKDGKVPYCPKPESFGWALLEIIGGERANIRETAVTLGFNSPTCLGAITRGNDPTQNYVSGWADIFARVYPEGWAKYGELYLQREGKLKLMGKKPAPLSLEAWRIAAQALISKVASDDFAIRQGLAKRRPEFSHTGKVLNGFSQEPKVEIIRRHIDGGSVTSHDLRGAIWEICRSLTRHGHVNDPVFTGSLTLMRQANRLNIA